MEQPTNRTGRALDDEPLPNLRAWRHHQSYSLRELAKLAELNRATLQRLELLGTPARPRTVRVLARALGISPSELRRQPPA
jgi:transcriptional regulator with XRE-family HTH domain